MTEVAAIHVAGGIMELRHGGSDGASHARPDYQRDQFNYREEDGDAHQDVGHAANEFSQRREKMTVQNCGPRRYLDKWAELCPLATRPHHYRQRSRKRDFPVKAAAGLRNRANGEVGMHLGVLLLLSPGLIFCDIESLPRLLVGSSPSGSR